MHVWDELYYENTYFLLIQLVGCGSKGTYQKQKKYVGVKETQMLAIVRLWFGQFRAFYYFLYLLLF